MKYNLKKCVTWVSPKPLIKDGVSEGVEQDEDGVVGGQVCLSTGTIQEQVSQIVQTSHRRVVGTLRGAVAYQHKQK